LALLVLAIAGFASDKISLVAAFVFTFLVPGLIGYRFFHLKSHEIWAFIPLFSVLISVQLIYYVSLAAGYSGQIIIACFLGLAALYTLVVYKKGELLRPSMLLRVRQIKKTSFLVFASIFLVSLIVLSFSVWRGNEYGIVLTGSNWQDTPFHYEIIESLNNGNFPPQTPQLHRHSPKLPLLR
jgi:hypothetical protein